MNELAEEVFLGNHKDHSDTQNKRAKMNNGKFMQNSAQHRSSVFTSLDVEQLPNLQMLPSTTPYSPLSGSFPMMLPNSRHNFEDVSVVVREDYTLLEEMDDDRYPDFSKIVAKLDDKDTRVGNKGKIEWNKWERRNSKLGQFICCGITTLGDILRENARADIDSVERLLKAILNNVDQGRYDDAINGVKLFAEDVRHEISHNKVTSS